MIQSFNGLQTRNRPGSVRAALGGSPGLTRAGWGKVFHIREKNFPLGPPCAGYHRTPVNQPSHLRASCAVVQEARTAGTNPFERSSPYCRILYNKAL